MTAIRVLPPFAAVEEFRPRARVRRQSLMKTAEAAGVRVWAYEDAVGLEYADGNDDFWISEQQMATAPDHPESWVEELFEEYRAIDAKRSRVLCAIRHVLVAAGARADQDRTGFWSVECGAVSSVFEVGSTLTDRILREGEEDALRHAIGDLWLWPNDRVRELLQRGPEGADWPDVAVRMGDRLEQTSLDKISWSTLHYLLRSGVEPRNERGREWPEDDVPDSPEMAFRAGPQLPELSDALASGVDVLAASTLEQYRKRAEEDALGYRMEWPWLVPEDTWPTLDWHLEMAERIVAKDSIVDERFEYSVIEARTTLVKHGRHEHRRLLLRDLDRWWSLGAHDLQDWPHLVALFPRHPAGTEVRDSNGDVPPPEALESELPPRRYFRETLLVCLREIAEAASEQDRIIALDDLHGVFVRIGATWVRRLLKGHEADLAEIRQATIELFNQPGAELALWFDDALAGAGCLGWTDVAAAARRHPDLSGMFFLGLATLERADLDAELEQARQAVEAGPPAPAGGRFESFVFNGRPLLVLSHLSPDLRVASLAASALLLCVNRRCMFDDQLAAAIAWQRCRGVSKGPSGSANWSPRGSRSWPASG